MIEFNENRLKNERIPALLNKADIRRFIHILFPQILINAANTAMEESFILMKTILDEIDAPTPVPNEYKTAS